MFVSSIERWIKRCEKNMSEVNIIAKSYPVNQQVFQKWSQHINMYERISPKIPENQNFLWPGKVSFLQRTIFVCTCSVVESVNGWIKKHSR